MLLIKKKSFFYFGAVVLALFLLWFINNNFNQYSISIFTNIAIFIIFATSYNLINGVTGQFSLEPNGFIAIGAYVASILLLGADAKEQMFILQDPSPIIMALHTSFLPAIIIGGVVSAGIAFIIAFPVFRVRGDYLAIVTLGFGLIISILLINNPQYSNGSLGMNNIPHTANLYWSGGIAIATVLIILNIINSKYGRAMRAIRDDEDVATAMGIDTFKIKMSAFMTSAFFEGVGGGIFASFLTAINPEQFNFLLTFQLLIIIVLGGLGSISGSIIATFLFVYLLEWLRFLDQPLNIFGYQTEALPGMRMVCFSIVLIVIMIFARRGLLADRELFSIIKDRFKKIE